VSATVRYERTPFVLLSVRVAREFVWPVKWWVADVELVPGGIIDNLAVQERMQHRSVIDGMFRGAASTSTNVESSRAFSPCHPIGEQRANRDAARLGRPDSSVQATQKREMEAFLLICVASILNVAALLCFPGRLKLRFLVFC